MQPPEYRAAIFNAFQQYCGRFVTVDERILNALLIRSRYHRSPTRLHIFGSLLQSIPAISGLLENAGIDLAAMVAGMALPKRIDRVGIGGITQANPAVPVSDSLTIREYPLHAQRLTPTALAAAKTGHFTIQDFFSISH